MNARPLVSAAAAAVLLAGCGLHNPQAPTSTTSTRSTPTSSSTTPATPTGSTRAPTVAQINRQDHPPVALVRRQEAAAAARPMLPALPITTSGVTIAIGGLAADGRTTILTLTTRLGRAHALTVYRHQLRLYGDTGHAYQPLVAP